MSYALHRVTDQDVVGNTLKMMLKKYEVHLAKKYLSQTYV